MTTEQLWQRIVGLAVEVAELRGMLVKHMAADNAIPRHKTEVIEPMRRVDTEQRWDDDWVNV